MPISIIFLPYLDLLLSLLAYARSFWLFCVFLCLAPGDDPSEHQARRINPGRATSKRYRTSEPTDGSSSTQPPPASASASVPPPPQHSKRSATKPKGRTVTEMTNKEFWEKRRRNPYTVDQEPTLVNRPFWNHFQFAIYFDVIKAKKNLYVDVRSIDGCHGKGS